ncbi:54S ribosomal protein L2 mitochondrial [Trapelia coarctata]|nr:54S ribosomal protein L2 mitochondrial [Trapelia coarctata]
MLQPRLQPRLHPISSLSTPSTSLLLALHRLSLTPSAPHSPHPHHPRHTRPASHASQGRANGPKQGAGKRLGAKKTDSELVVPGNIIFRQRGTHWFPGENCGMGRDHTIFALARGFVRYYQDPEFRVRGKGRGEAGMGRKYIGIVHRQEDKLPRGRGECRRRVLGMEFSTVAGGAQRDVDGEGKGEGEGEGMGMIEVGSVEGVVDGVEVRADIPVESKGMVKIEETAKAEVLQRPVLRPGHTYMESNWSIGRAAERAGVKVRVYNPKDRFLAWRKSSARKARNAEKRGLTRRKGKK